MNLGLLFLCLLLAALSFAFAAWYLLPRRFNNGKSKGEGCKQ